MISANEAAKVAQDVVTTTNNLTIKSIGDQIEASANRGESAIFLDNWINPAVVSHLQSLGYKVERAGPSDDDVQVSWS